MPEVYGHWAKPLDAHEKRAYVTVILFFVAAMFWIGVLFATTVPMWATCVYGGLLAGFFVVYLAGDWPFTTRMGR